MDIIDIFGFFGSLSLLSFGIFFGLFSCMKSSSVGRRSPQAFGFWRPLSRRSFKKKSPKEIPYAKNPGDESFHASWASWKLGSKFNWSNETLLGWLLVNEWSKIFHQARNLWKLWWNSLTIHYNLQGGIFHRLRWIKHLDPSPKISHTISFPNYLHTFNFNSSSTVPGWKHHRFGTWLVVESSSYQKALHVGYKLTNSSPCSIGKYLTISASLHCLLHQLDYNFELYLLMIKNCGENNKLRYLKSFTKNFQKKSPFLRLISPFHHRKKPSKSSTHATDFFFPSRRLVQALGDSFGLLNLRDQMEPLSMEKGVTPLHLLGWWGPWY